MSLIKGIKMVTFVKINYCFVAMSNLCFTINITILINYFSLRTFYYEVFCLGKQGLTRAYLTRNM